MIEAGRFKKLKQIFFSAAKKYKKDDPMRLAGTTAYFTIFAMAPVIIILISLLGFFVGQDPIQEKVFSEMEGIWGAQNSLFVKNIVDNFQEQKRSTIGSLVLIGIFLFTSTTLFIVLQNSLNYIWRIKVKVRHHFLKSLKDRLLSFAMILSLGFILLVSLLVDTLLSVFYDFINSFLPDIPFLLIEMANSLFSFGVIWIIFAMIFKFLPDAKIKWKVIWQGALVTTLLFIVGKFVIELVLSNSNIGVMYGAAGSLVIILLWVFYSSVIFFFGAEVTQQLAHHYDNGVELKSYAVHFIIGEEDKTS